MIRSKSHKSKSNIDRKNFMENINKIENSETTIDNDENININNGTNEIIDIDNVKGKKKKKRKRQSNKFSKILFFIKKNWLSESIIFFLLSLLLSAVGWGINLQNKTSNIEKSLNNIENIIINKIGDTDIKIKDYKNDILIEIKDIRNELHILKDDTSKNLTEIKTFLYLKKK